MMKKPRIKYNYHFEMIDDDKAVLSSEKNNTVLIGKSHCLVLSEIQHEGIEIEDLVDRLRNKIPRMEVYISIQYLNKQGYITEDVSFLSKEICAFWNGMEIEVHVLRRILEEKAIVLQTIGPISPEIFRKPFSLLGINTCDLNDRPALRVVITDNYQRKELRQINVEAMGSDLPWLLVKPVDVEYWIGPLFKPGETGCWECLNQRLEINRPINTFYQMSTKRDENLKKPLSLLPTNLQTVANQTAIEVIKWLYFNENKKLEGKIISFHTETLENRSHSLVKRPQCHSCGTSETEWPEPITIREKRFPDTVTNQGGYRDCSSEDTVEKFQHHISPITGVIQSLKRYHRIESTPIYNYSSGHNIALKSKTLFWLNEHIRSASGGKGKTFQQAKAGAICEAIERYSLVYQGDEPCISGSLKSIGEDAIHPNKCMNYSENQFENRTLTNGNCSKFYSLVPIPFDETLSMDWTPVYSLNEKKFKYLPSCFCYAQYPAGDDNHLFSYPDSNGCAAGNSIEEAMLQGFLELVERDGVAIWWYNRLRKPGVDLLSFNEPYFAQLLKYYKSLNRSLYVLDLKTDLDIPIFAALSHKTDGGNQNIIFGFGAHVDTKIAIERALVELNQILPIANVDDSQRANGNFLTKDKSFVDWLNTATLENEFYLAPDDNLPTKTISDYPCLCDPSIFSGLKFCVKAAEKQGLETLVLDLTRKDVGLPVVKVVVPGLRHFWQRLAPGRLYDVPVKMNYFEKPLREKELNPVGLFI